MNCRMDITGKKIWRDGDNVTETRPPSVEITLLRNGEVYKSVTVNSTGDGIYAFACLPVWKSNSEKYVYTVDEIEVPKGYTKAIEGYNVINTFNPGLITITGAKIWVDNNNEGSTRPAEITITLLQNGIQYLSTLVTSPPDEEDTAEFSFADVPQFDHEGNPFVYTVDENEVVGYDKSISGFNITNTLEKSVPPVINTVRNTDTEITGTGIDGCEVVVTLPSGETVKVTVDEYGNWSIPAEGLAEGDIIRAYQRCRYKLPSDSVETTVISLGLLIDYLNNGGTGEFSDSGIAYGTNYRIRSLEETGIQHPGTGVWFSAWNTEPDGSGESYSGGQVIELTEDLVLYAQWFVWYNVSYSRNTTSPFVHIDNGRSDRPYTIIRPEDVDISREGYEFVSWNTQANGKGTTYHPGDIVTLTGALRVYAQWEEII